MVRLQYANPKTLMRMNLKVLVLELRVDLLQGVSPIPWQEVQYGFETPFPKIYISRSFLPT